LLAPLVGDIDDTCLIWVEGFKEWIPATSVKGLLPAKPTSEPPPLPPQNTQSPPPVKQEVKQQTSVKNVIQPSNFLIAVSPERVEYNAIRLKYQKLAEKATKDFSEKWFKDIDDLHERAATVVFNAVMPVVDVAISDLVARGIVDIDEKYFLENYLEFSWEKDFEEIDEQYIQIVLKAEELDAYRTARRQSRSRFVGGGFGIEGAIDGMFKAGATNLAVGALHGTFNLGAKVITSAVNAVKKSQLFNDPATKTSLVNAFYWQLFLVHTALIEAINDKKPNSISGWVDKEEALKATRLFENINKGRVSKQEAENMLPEILSLNPYDEAIYMYWMQDYGDDNNLLERTAEYFGVISFCEDKKTIQAILSLKDGIIPEYKCPPELALKSLDYFIKLANQGNKQAQFHLGMIYENGIGVSKDLTQAQNYYQKLAAQGFSNAQLALGIMYENAGNQNEALIWYGKAVAQGNKEALKLQNQLNQKIEDWENTKKDIKDGFHKIVFYGRAIIYFGLMAFGVIFIIGGVSTSLVEIFPEGKIGDGFGVIGIAFLVGLVIIKLANKVKPESLNIINNLLGFFKKVRIKLE
jgi:TPR repeat protein